MDEDWPLLQKVQRGDESGLVELMARHKEALFRFIYRYVRNESDAAELTELTFYRVYQKADRFRPKAKVGTWIFSIAGNLCRDFLRRNNKRKNDLLLSSHIGSDENSTLEAIISSEAPAPSEQTESNEALRRLELLIHELPYKLKAPFILCVLEGHSYSYCAEVLKTNHKAIENRIYRARKLLKERLEASAI